MALEVAGLIAVSDDVPRERASRCAHQPRASSPPCLSGRGSWHRGHASLGTRTDPRSRPADGSPSPAHIRRNAGCPSAAHSGRVDRAPLPAGTRRHSAAARRCSLRRERSPRSSPTDTTPGVKSHRRGPSAASGSDLTGSSGIHSPMRNGRSQHRPRSSHLLSDQAEAPHRSPQHLYPKASPQASIMPPNLANWLGISPVPPNWNSRKIGSPRRCRWRVPRRRRRGARCRRSKCS